MPLPVQGRIIGQVRRQQHDLGSHARRLIAGAAPQGGGPVPPGIRNGVLEAHEAAEAGLRYKCHVAIRLQADRTPDRAGQRTDPERVLLPVDIVSQQLPGSQHEGALPPQPQAITIMGQDIRGRERGIRPAEGQVRDVVHSKVDEMQLFDILQQVVAIPAVHGINNADPPGVLPRQPVLCKQAGQPDDILPLAAINDIAARPALQDVVASPAIQPVVVQPAIQVVMARATIKTVLPPVPAQDVVSVPAMQPVCPFTAGQGIVGRTAMHLVITITTVNEQAVPVLIIDPQHIGAGAAQYRKSGPRANIAQVLAHAGITGQLYDADIENGPARFTGLPQHGVVPLTAETKRGWREGQRIAVVGLQAVGQDPDGGGMAGKAGRRRQPQLQPVPIHNQSPAKTAFELALARPARLVAAGINVKCIDYRRGRNVWHAPGRLRQTDLNVVRHCAFCPFVHCCIAPQCHRHRYAGGIKGQSRAAFL